MPNLRKGVGCEANPPDSRWTLLAVVEAPLETVDTLYVEDGGDDSGDTLEEEELMVISVFDGSWDRSETGEE